jgi:4'-phosphopantetheinyl transferase
MKAGGDGLSKPLDSFRVTLLPGVPARLVHDDRWPGAADAWTLDDLTPAPGSAAALAYQDAPRDIRMLPLVEAGDLIA